MLIHWALKPKVARVDLSLFSETQLTVIFYHPQPHFLKLNGKSLPNFLFTALVQLLKHIFGACGLSVKKNGSSFLVASLVT